MSVMTDARQTTPSKVLERAREQGVHEKCIEADHRGACASCVLIIQEVFDHFYGHVSTPEEALDLILIDLLNDLESE